MTAPRASLLRRLSWWLRGGPARQATRAARRMGFPPAHATVIGWCEWVAQTIVLAPPAVGVSTLTGFLFTGARRGCAALTMVLALLVAPPFALHTVATPRGALIVLLGVPLAFVAGLGLIVMILIFQARARARRP